MGAELAGRQPEERHRIVSARAADAVERAAGSERIALITVCSLAVAGHQMRPRLAEGGGVGILVVIERPGQPDLMVVHAAGSDPDVPGDPLPVTACGLDTMGMAVDPWRPSGPGSRWYPPEYAGHICPRCERAVRST